ncbi:hypothetical protein CK203_014538 [Vitis vinifera]|uniref:Peptidase S9A N-terminal domain-containing protein n=1 Tax=Vitis vinifera TaxID=29760 RepID=A0A438K541_VITVI|nr:hypothetical protein CK203_014538 [Vitis vinifera]
MLGFFRTKQGLQRFFGMPFISLLSFRPLAPQLLKAFPLMWFNLIGYHVKIQKIQLFSDHLVVHERENGLPKVTVYRLPAVGEPLTSLQGGQTIDFLDPVYTVDPSESQFSSSILRFSYSSLRTPRSVYDYDMRTGISVLKNIETSWCPVMVNRTKCCFGWIRFPNWEPESVEVFRIIYGVRGGFKCIQLNQANDGKLSVKSYVKDLDGLPGRSKRASLGKEEKHL